MSSHDPLTEDDRQLLAAIDDEVEAAGSPEEYEVIVRDLRDELLEFKIETRRRLATLEDAIDDLKSGDSDGADPDGPPLFHYANIPAEEREDILPTSQHIAVTIHEYWDDVAWTLGGGSNYTGATSAQRRGVDTKTAANAKYNPSRLRHRLKQLLDRDPPWNEIYRGLKQLAELSGGEERVDDKTGRTHVFGGLYHYEERATADGSDTKRVCWRVER